LLAWQARAAPRRSAPASRAAAAGPVWIAGGATTIGSRVKDIEAIGRERETDFPRWCARPRATSRRRLWLMVTETTNEQYEATPAAGIRPPRAGARTIDDASELFVRTSSAASSSPRTPATRAADRDLRPRPLVEENWQQKTGACRGQAAAPVVYVEYADIVGYALAAAPDERVRVPTRRPRQGPTSIRGNNFEESRA